MKHAKQYKHKPQNTEANKARFLDALSKNLGLVLRASIATHIPSMTHYVWMGNDPIYKKKVEDMIELKRDFVEHHLQNLVRKEESSCIQFAAKSLLRKRGYDQSSELKNADGEKFQIAVSPELVKKALDDTYHNADS